MPRKAGKSNNIQTAPLDGESHVLFVCEGTAEQVIVDILRKADAFVFPSGNVLDSTRVRTAQGIQRSYLNYEHEWPLTIVRVLDSLGERFELGKLYRERYPVATIHTRPEIEMLAIIREGALQAYSKVSSSQKPSEFCKDTLRMGAIKRREFLLEYWDAPALISAATEYKKVHSFVKGERCLADILKQD